MKLKELKRIARRIKEPSFDIAKDGEVVIRGTFLGWYTGKDDSILGTTIEVGPEDEYPTEWIYGKTPMSKDFEKNCYGVDKVFDSVFHEGINTRDADEYARDMYLYAKDQDFDPLEHLFEGAPVMFIHTSDEWFMYDAACIHSVRLPTIEESPLNMKLAWHPQLGKPEKIDNYETIVWYINGHVRPSEHKANFWWDAVVAFMLLKKKER